MDDPLTPVNLRQRADQMHDLATGYGMIAAALEELPDLPLLYRPLAMHVALELRARADHAMIRAADMITDAQSQDEPLEGWSDAHRS
jgi:hypothetical protein